MATIQRALELAKIKEQDGNFIALYGQQPPYLHYGLAYPNVMPQGKPILGTYLILSLLSTGVRRLNYTTLLSEQTIRRCRYHPKAYLRHRNDQHKSQT